MTIANCPIGIRKLTKLTKCTLTKRKETSRKKRITPATALTNTTSKGFYHSN